MKRVTYRTNQSSPKITEYRRAVEKGMQSHHVLPRGNEWVVKHAGSPRASRVFTTQSEATTYARSVSDNQGTALFIHGANGRIRERRDR